MKVRELILPLDRCNVVSDTATLEEVFLKLEAALEASPDAAPGDDRDLAVVVLDRDGRFVGKLSVWDLLAGLEPQARRRVDALAMVEGYDLWDRPLAHLSAKAKNLRAKDLVRPLRRDERIDQEAGLDEALLRLVANRRPFLVVTRGREAVGLLRVADVFRHVCERLRSLEE